MIVLESDKVAFFDIDDTLVAWRPVITVDVDATYIEMQDSDGTTQLLEPMWKNIEALKLHKLRGQKIVVWSAGGYDWARQAVEALGLENYVDIVMSKPAWWYDDMTAEEVLLPSLRRFNKEE